MACVYIGQVTEHTVSPDAAKATPKFSPSRHYSLVCVKKKNIFLLASILLLRICLAGFSSARLAHLYLLPACTNFRRISALTSSLSVCTFLGAFFCLLCNENWCHEYCEVLKGSAGLSMDSSDKC